MKKKDEFGEGLVIGFLLALVSSVAVRLLWPVFLDWLRFAQSLGFMGGLFVGAFVGLGIYVVVEALLKFAAEYSK